MLASTIRFSNHYQTPPHTRQQYCQQRVGLGPVEPHLRFQDPTACLSYPPPIPPSPEAHDPDNAGWTSEKNVMFHP